MFKIPSKDSIEDVIKKEFVVVDSKTLVSDAMDTVIDNEVIISMDFDKEIADGYILSSEFVGQFLKDGSDLKKMTIGEVAKKDFIIIDNNYDMENFDNLLKTGDYIYIVVNNTDIVGYICRESVKDAEYYFLKEKYESLKSITETINQGISAIDKNGVVILWNSFMAQRYNISEEEMIGRKMSDYLEDTISERALITREVMSDIYYSNINEAGADLYGVVTASPVYHEGEFVGVVCTEVDVTDANRLSKELEVTQEKIKYLENQVRTLSKGEFDQIIGKSYLMEKAKGIAKQVAKTNSSIMINGESGTGKEVFARAIHRYSGRAGTFIPVNCSAIPQELFESEFFGYAPGAFTGANKSGKAGIFELADEGTIFLDEIGDLPFNMQAKLLRVLQEREVMRVGGRNIIKVNVRVISASNKDLKSLVKSGEFRDDLYYRLNVVEINLPPLRDRKNDIGTLIYHFMEILGRENNKPFLKINKEAFKVLERYSWKGNIRELKNTIENMVVLSSSNTLDIEDIPDYIIESVRGGENKDIYPMDLNMSVEILEKSKIKEALTMTNNNKTKAAKILNIPRTTLYYKMREYSIE